MICINNYCWGDYIKEGETCRACGAKDRREISTGFWRGNPKEIVHFKD